jgi:hypothetical protein
MTGSMSLFIAYCEMVESKASDWNIRLKVTRNFIPMGNWYDRTRGLAQTVKVTFNN